MTSAAANRARQRYFDPSEDTERKFVGLGQRVRARFESLDEWADERHQDNTNSGTTYRVSTRNISLASTNEKIRSPALSTTPPIRCVLNSLIVSQGPISKCASRGHLL